MMIQLASTSPRRSELLAAAGVPFAVVPTDTNERMNPDFSPEVNAMVSGWQKARSAIRLGARGMVLGCDTIVVADGEILEKPKDRNDAFRMIRKLAGNTHCVISGYGLIHTEKKSNRADFVVSFVTVREMSDEEIEGLLDTGEYQGKSGAYMVQGSMRQYITKIEGSVDSIVGLPVSEILECIEREENGSAHKVQDQGTAGGNPTA